MHRKRITSSKIIAITDYGYQRRECSIAVIESFGSARFYKWCKHVVPGPAVGSTIRFGVWRDHRPRRRNYLTEEESTASDSRLAVEVGSKADVLPPRLGVGLKELFQRQRLREGVFAGEGRSRDGHGREIWRR